MEQLFQNDNSQRVKQSGSNSEYWPWRPFQQKVVSSRIYTVLRIHFANNHHLFYDRDPRTATSELIRVFFFWSGLDQSDPDWFEMFEVLVGNRSSLLHIYRMNSVKFEIFYLDEFYSNLKLSQISFKNHTNIAYAIHNFRTEIRLFNFCVGERVVRKSPEDQTIYGAG